MTDPTQTLIDCYLDGMLSPVEEKRLVAWLQAAPENSMRFAAEVMLHDRLQALLVAKSHPDLLSASPRPRYNLRGSGPFTTVAVTITAAVILLIIAAIGFESRSVSAAVIQLDQLIAAQGSLPGSTYRIVVETRRRPTRQRYFEAAPDGRTRPPKQPLDGAILHVSGRRFVLIRATASGDSFITGSDGQSSWAVTPEGPVRISSSVTHFNRDLPGHEHDMPLVSITDGLGRLHEAYELRIDSGAAPAFSRLVAEKHPGFRGPQRVVIEYDEATGQINSLQFTEMPYGPERLSLRMDLIKRGPYEDDFFRHAAHHAPDRIILEE